MPYRLSAGLLSGLLLAATVAAQPATPSDPEPLRLQPAQVQALGVQTARLDGVAEATLRRYPAQVLVPVHRQRVLAAPLAARVEQQAVALGDTVRAGQPLLRLRSLQAQELQRELSQSASQADLAARSRARDEQLHAEGLIPAARLDASRAADTQARTLHEERLRALRLNGLRPEAPGELSLASPLAGVVIEAPLTVGQRVEAGDMLMRVADLSTLWLELTVPVAEADALRPGEAVQVEGVAAVGRVIGSAGVVDPATQTLRVRAEISPPPAASGRRLRPGQLIEVGLAPRGTGLLTVDSAAVLRHRGRSVVFIETAPGAYRLQPVTVQGGQGARLAVTGLAPGSLVVVRGTAALLALLP